MTLARTRLDGILEGLSILGLLAMTALLAYYWTALPPVVPTHFGITGMPDAWGSKWLELLPLALGTVLYGGLTIMGRYPHLFNYPWPITQENAPQQYRLARTLVTALKTEIMWLFAFVEWGTIRTAPGLGRGLGPWALPALVITISATLAVWYKQASRARTR